MRSARRGLLFLALACAAGCAPPSRDERPSILLVVIDTLRADAVSAYGEVEGTTPAIDALAAEGLRYTRAFAPSPWTLPSHATLLTGLPLERHGVGVGGAMVLDAGIDTLAERLGAAGYRTAAFSENPLVGPHFHLEQGFGHFAGASVEQAFGRQLGFDVPAFDVVAELERWARRRPDGRPDFVFVNLFDPHDPYYAGDVNPFVPEAVSKREIEAAERPVGMCDRLPASRTLALAKGLYLGEVARADGKLGRLREVVAASHGGGFLVTLVTSDHGEHLGEHRLLGHEFSVRHPVLHVPLVVHGLPGVEPAAIDRPVELADLAASILSWAGLGSGPGLPLESTASDAADPIVAFYGDDPRETPATIGFGRIADGTREAKRAGCRDDDRVFGDTLSVLRFPFKLIWFEHHPPQLYDLRWDTREISDLAAQRPDLVEALRAEALARRRELAAAAARNAAGAPDAEAVQALRELGYVE